MIPPYESPIKINKKKIKMNQNNTEYNCIRIMQVATMQDESYSKTHGMQCTSLHTTIFQQFLLQKFDTHSNHQNQKTSIHSLKKKK